MYTEETRKVLDWRNIIRKGLLVLLAALIIFLLVWLFTRNLNKKNNIDNNTNNNGIVDPVDNNSNNEINIDGKTYSEGFITNYTNVKSAAKDYFSTGDLPKAGTFKKYTLRELIANQIILPSKYSTNCDVDSSYIIIVNENGTYKMTTNLVCGNEVASTTEELVCSNICSPSCDDKDEPSGKDTDYKIEYQHRQSYTTTETVYSCPKGYTKSGTNCVRDNKSTVKSTEKIDYLCKDGYTKVGSGSNTKCTKTVKDTYTLTCPSEYSQSGATCTKSSKDTYTLTCPSGYSQSGATCTKKVDSPYTYGASVKSYSCSNGTNLNNGYCRIFSTTGHTEKLYVPMSPSTAASKGCISTGSYTETCTTCATRTRTVFTYYCSATSSRDVPANVNYDCPYGGTLRGTTCYVSNSYTDTKTLTCKSDYAQSGATCTKTTTDTKTLTCKSEYSQSGATCTKTTTDTKDATPTATYSCPKGYTKQGFGPASICTRGSSSINPTTASTKTVTKYRYKWSSEYTIYGWERTGQTRQVPINNTNEVDFK